MDTLTISRNGNEVPEILKDIPARIASVLAHEVRNPLTNISLAIGMLESYIKDDEAKVYLDIIMRSSMRINILINERLRKRSCSWWSSRREYPRATTLSTADRRS